MGCWTLRKKRELAGNAAAVHFNIEIEVRDSLRALLSFVVALDLCFDCASAPRAAISRASRLARSRPRGARAGA